MIIVEGPDGSGKSKLIEKLGLKPVRFRALRGGIGGSAPNGMCARSTSGWADPLDSAPVAYARALLDRQPGEALDRFHLSEIVYGPMLRGRTGLPPAEDRVLRRLLHARGVRTVICLPSFSTTLANVERTGRERPLFQTGDFLLEAYERWAELAHEESEADPNTIVFDYTNKTADAIYRIITRERLPTLPEGMVGSPTAKVLLVGERSNLNIDLPFFSTAGSAGYLQDRLDMAGFTNDQVAYVNGYYQDSRTRPLKIPCTVQAVVCLGKVALASVAKQFGDIKGPWNWHDIEAPSYWKRFHPGETLEYSGKLEDVRVALTVAA